MRLTAALTSLTLLASTLASGQTLRGTLVQSDSLTPIAGAMVVLVDGGGTRQGSVLSDARGRFTITAPTAGSFAVLVFRIGFESWQSEPLALTGRAGAAQQFVLPSLAVQLAELVASAPDQCRELPVRGLATGALWEEARKALSAAVWTDATNELRFRSRIYERDTDRRDRVERQSDSTFVGARSAPFRSRSVDELSQQGYIVNAGREIRFFAPDADVLLSDEFLADHCFRAVHGSGDTEDLVGLAFEPVAARTTPDITGVLWVDPASSELRHVEFTFANVPDRVRADNIGGRIEFERIQGGGWIVRRWWIRMPRTELRTIGTSINRTEITRIIGYREAGGEVQSITGARLAQGQAPARVMGVVFDSTLGQPVAGARVSLTGTDHAAITEGTGRYVISGPFEGSYAVTLSSPRADSLGFTPPQRTVQLTSGRLRSVNFAIPSFETLAAEACGDTPMGTTPALIGIVRNQEGTPLPGARVRATWMSEIEGRPQMERRTTVTNRRGRYALCDLPNVAATDLAALFGIDRSEVISLVAQEDTLFARGASLPANGPLRTLDLIVTRRADQVATIGGTVVDGVRGAPLANAMVELPVLGLETRSGQDGRFAFEGLPAGNHRVLVRHVQFQPETRWVDLQTSDTFRLAAEIQLDPTATELPALVAEARAAASPSLMASGFYERRDRGFGTFFTREDLLEIEPRQVSDALQRVPGVRMGMRITRGLRQPTFQQDERTPEPVNVLERETPLIELDQVNARTRVLQMRNGCEPRVYLDGAPLSDALGANIDDILAVADIQAIEVYTSSAQVPAEFFVDNVECGVVAIWTR